MSYSSIEGLAYCRARARPIFAADGRSFLGTSCAFGRNTLLTCNHCVFSQDYVVSDQLQFLIETRLIGCDLALLRSREPADFPYFIVSSEGVQFGEQVVVYGFRRRDDEITDVLFSTDIGVTESRHFQHGVPPIQLCGFGKRNLVEPGMSGGVVLRAATFEVVGYLIGYDRPYNNERKDDVFVVFANVIESYPELRSYVTFSHQKRGKLVNLTRRLVSLAGFAVQAETLGKEPGLEECLLCTRGNGPLAQRIIVVTATVEHMRGIEALRALNELSKSRAGSRSISYDRAVVVVDGPIGDGQSLNFVITIEELRNAAKHVPSSENIKSLNVLPRFVSREGETTPEPGLVALERAVASGAKLIAISGPMNSGKRTLLSSFQTKCEANLFSGLESAPIAFTVLFSSGADEIPLQHGPDSEPTVAVIRDFEQVLATLGTVTTLRKLKQLVLRLNQTTTRWSIILALSGTSEYVKAILLPEIREHLGGIHLILEMLPLSTETVRAAFETELGEADGKAHWHMVASSQEIFQIAQWPAGLFLILDRVVRPSLPLVQVKQVQIIAALVHGYLSRGAGGVPPAATFNFLTQLSKEINSNQNLEVPIERARNIYAGAAPEPHIIHTIAVSDVLVAGLISLSHDTQTVRFENPIFIHYFLASAIADSIRAQDLSPRNPLYHRRIPVALLNDVMDLGIQRDQLLGLIMDTTGKTPEEVGFIGGNCISLLRLLKTDFRGVNLANCNLRGCILAGCDLSGANFTNATLVDAGLSNATIQGTTFIGADLARADLKSGCTIYQLVSRGDTIFAATSLRKLVSIESSSSGFTANDLPGFTDAVFAAAISEQQSLLIAGGQDGTVRGWDYAKNEPRFILRGPFSDVRCVSFLGDLVVAGSVDGRVYVWAPWSARLLRAFKSCGGEIWSLAALDQSSLLVLCDRGHVHLHDLNDGAERDSWNLPTGYARRLTLDRSRVRALVGGEGFVWCLDVASRGPSTADVPHPCVRTILHSLADDLLLGGAYGKVISADYRLRDFNEVRTDGPDYISDFALIRNGTVLAADACGSLLQLTRREGRWNDEGIVARLGTRLMFSANGAIFTGVRNLPAERRTRLAEAGAATN